MKNKGDNIDYDGQHIIYTTHYIPTKEDNGPESMIFTTRSIPRNIDNYYFEMHVDDQGEDACIGIGLSNGEVDTRNGRMPGWDSSSIGYHADDGGIFHDDGYHKEIIEPYGTGDTVGCMAERVHVSGNSYLRVYFTKNGSALKSTRWLADDDYYPTIGLGSRGAKVTPNMGINGFLHKFKGNILHYFA